MGIVEASQVDLLRANDVHKLRRFLVVFAAIVLTQDSALAASFIVFDFDDIQAGVDA